VWEVRDGVVRELTLEPLDVDIPRARPEELQGGDVAHNVAVARALFAGETGAVRDAVVLNAAAGLAAHAGLSGDLVTDLRAGVTRAGAALDSGAAKELLANWVAAGRLLAADH
jgi:anthranilate phosphoribosyltransferase